MDEIPAASAMQWNVELDRGLRSQKTGSQYEAILKLALRIQQWSREPPASPVIASLYKLEMGQEQAFLNAIMMHLMEAFRSGDNFTKLCILKVLLLEMKSRKNGVKNLHGKGLITNERISNHAEVLKRVKAIITSGDHTAKALALLVVGCLAELGKDSVDLHRLVFEAIYSPYECEVRAALCTLGCFCEISDHFSLLALDRISDILNAMNTPTKVRIQAIFVLPHMHVSQEVSMKAYEVGKTLMLRMPVEEVVFPMLESLSRLASKSSIILAEQVDLLLKYICSDPRSTVHVVALKCLARLARKCRGRIRNEGETVAIMLSILENPKKPFHLKALSLQTLKALFPFAIMAGDANHLIRLLSIAELSAMRSDWPQVKPVLGLLVDLIYDLEKMRPEVIPMADIQMGLDKFSLFQDADVDMIPSTSKASDSIHALDLPARAALLICDHLALLANSWDQQVLKKELDDLSEKTASKGIELEERCQYLCTLMLKLAKGSTGTAYVIVDCLCGMVEAFLKELQKLQNRQGNRNNSMPEEHAKGLHPAESVSKKSRTQSKVFITRSPLLKSMCLCIRDCGLASMFEEECLRKTVKRLNKFTSHAINANVSTNVSKSLLPILLKCKSYAMPKEAGLISNEIYGIAESFLKDRDYWSAYKIVTLAACNGLWIGFKPLIEQISCKAQSGGSLFWLKALVGIYAFESSIQCECDKIKYANDSSDLMLLDTYTKQISSDSLTLNIGKAIAQSLSSVHSAESSLAAGAKLHRTFEFQRQVLSLRVSFIHTSGELLGLLGPICVDFKASDVDMVCSSMIDVSSLDDDSMKPLISSIQAVAIKAKTIASQLWKLAASFDIVRVSNLGIDNTSANQLCLAALGCSFISFCTIYCLSDLQGSNMEKDLSSLSRRDSVVNDLYHRVNWIGGEECPELLSIMLKSGIIHGSMLIGRWDSSGSIMEKKILEFVMWAIREAVHLQQDDIDPNQKVSWVALARGMHKLKYIVEKWLCIPWALPKHFLCTRPSVGIEVFTEDKPTIPQGSSSSINLCFQIRNLDINGKIRVKKLCCALVLKPSKMLHKFYVGWSSSSYTDIKNDWNESDLLLVEELMERVSNFNQSTTLGMDVTQVVQCDVNDKGQGISSCTVSTLDLECGLFHVNVVAVCMDSRGHIWILHPMTNGPTITVIAATK